MDKAAKMDRTNERASYSGFRNPDFFSVDNLSGKRRHLRFNERADPERSVRLHAAPAVSLAI